MTATSPTPARGLDTPNPPSQARGQLTKEETGELVEHSSIGPSEPSRPDSKDDPDMPLDWPRSRKATIIALVAFSTFNDATASTMFAPGVSQVLRDFHRSDPSLGSLMISVHIVGFVAGPLVLAPLSEIYGRCPLMHASNVLFMISAIISAVSVDVPTMMVARVLMGLAGCVPNTLGGGIIADMMPVEERGIAMSLWGSGMLVGSVTGPIMGGYMTMNIGWRWTFWFGAIVSACVTIACLLFLRETYAPVICKRTSPMPNGAGGPAGQAFRQAISRPAKLLFRSPIVLLASLYNSIAYVYLYFMITTFPRLFGQRYNFNIGQVGLAYIGQGVGFGVAQWTVGALCDWNIRRLQATRGFSKPEDRLPPLLVGCCSIGIGLILFGWTAEAGTHWIAPIIGSGLVGFGSFYHFVAIGLYLVDAFTRYAASAIAANVIIRSILGALLPLLGPALYDNLGYGWGNTCLGMIALMLAPTTLLLYRYGEKIRTHPKFQVAL